MCKSTLRRADLVFSFLLYALGIATMISSVAIFFNPFGMEFDRVKGETIKQTILKWYESPALMPFVLSFVIILLASQLHKVAVRDGAKLDFLTKEHAIAFLKLRETKVATIVMVILTAYIFVLIPQCRAHLDFFPRFQGFPFMVATFFALVCQMIIFQTRTMKNVVTSLIVAAISSAVITYGFGVLALIPLP